PRFCAARHAAPRGRPSFPTRRSSDLELTSLLKAVGTMWLHGAEPNWKAIYGGKEIDKLNLPNYAFDKKRCWVDPPSFLSTTTVSGLHPKKVETPEDTPEDTPSRLVNRHSPAVKLQEI